MTQPYGKCKVLFIIEGERGGELLTTDMPPVEGIDDGVGHDVLGRSRRGGLGVRGESGSGIGVGGISGSGSGVHGYSNSGPGVRGFNINGNGPGVFGLSEYGYGVYGRTYERGFGVFGRSDSIGVGGNSHNGIGVDGYSLYYAGVSGWSCSDVGFGATAIEAMACMAQAGAKIAMLHIYRGESLYAVLSRNPEADSR